MVCTCWLYVCGVELGVLHALTLWHDGRLTGGVWRGEKRAVFCKCLRRRLEGRATGRLRTRKARYAKGDGVVDSRGNSLWGSAQLVVLSVLQLVNH